MRHKAISLLVLIVCSTRAMASGDSAAVDFLRSIGKIYSVVAVIVAIFLGIVIYLYRIDKKLTKLENQINNEQ